VNGRSAPTLSRLPTLSDKHIVALDAFSRKVLPKLAVCKRSADLLFPPSYVFEGICVDRVIGSPVCLAIRLLVSRKIYTSSCDSTGGR
jgi:hypothetical protein